MKQILMKKILIITPLFFVLISNAQYYYNDIISLTASNSLYLTYQKNNIQQITAQSLEADNTPTPGFSYERQIKNNDASVITQTALESSGISTTYETYQNNVLIHFADSSINSFSNVDYTYNSQGNILNLKTQTIDTSMDMQTTELHQWFYNGNVPDSMLRIKDNADTTVVHFIKDEKQNIAEEIWMKKSRIIEHYYYYYDNQNRITDIVRFDQRAKQMLPDFIFEYNTDNNISQMTEIPQGSSNYVIWAYIYDEKGLKTKDILYDKHQQLLGTVTYSFQ